MFKKTIIFFTILLISSGIVSAVGKKGTTFGSDTFGDLAICKDIRDLKVSWYYNWDIKPNCVTNANLIDGVQFYPTIWGANNLNADTGKNIAKADVLFTFNEVNFHGQADMTPAAAAAKWPDIQKLGFKYIVGPSIADCPDKIDPNSNNCKYGGIRWYADFFAACPNCQVDYVNIHIYYCNADDVMKKITDLNKATGKKVWLTEFNCDGATTDQKVLDYAKNLIPRLEASDIVVGYSWFLPYYTEGGNVNSLYLNQNGNGNLSEIGKYYASVVTNTSSTTTSSSTTTASGSSTTSGSTSTAGSTTTASGSSTTDSTPEGNTASKSSISILLLILLLISLLF